MCLSNRELRVCLEDTIVFKVVLDREGVLYTLFRGITAGGRFGSFNYDNVKLDSVLDKPSPVWPDHGVTAFFDMESANTYCHYIEEEFLAENIQRFPTRIPATVRVVALYLLDGIEFYDGTVAFSRSGLVIMELNALEAEIITAQKPT